MTEEWACGTGMAVHEPGKILLDLAVAVALGGDCAADIAAVRPSSGVRLRTSWRLRGETGIRPTFPSGRWSA